MVESMTGYGQSTASVEGKKLKIEIKSLNGKATDIRMRIPNNFKEKEIELRNLVLNKVKRGKIDLTIQSIATESEGEYIINKALFTSYYNEIVELKKTMSFDEGDIVQTIMRIPNVVMANDSEMSDGEWQQIQSLLFEAIDEFQKFRITEGEAMYKDFLLRISNIQKLLKDSSTFEKERIENIKSRIKKNINQHFSSETIDENRFEQELIYYIERLDITEEKVRLSQHCNYFLEVIESKDDIKGKKLGFIAQEMGREINTLGAKSQNSDLQQIVVRMKDELEKIKEQLANVV